MFTNIMIWNSKREGFNNLWKIIEIKKESDKLVAYRFYEKGAENGKCYEPIFLY